MILPRRRTLSLKSFLSERVIESGIAFISADYRLMPSGGVTGHEILEDVKDAFTFVSGRTFTDPKTSTTYTVDGDNLLAAGTSAGGLCAYFAAMHATPRPKAVLSMYGMGGNFLVNTGLLYKQAESHAIIDVTLP